MLRRSPPTGCVVRLGYHTSAQRFHRYVHSRCARRRGGPPPARGAGPTGGQVCPAKKFFCPATRAIRKNPGPLHAKACISDRHSVMLFGVQKPGFRRRVVPPSRGAGWGPCCCWGCCCWGVGGSSREACGGTASTLYPWSALSYCGTLRQVSGTFAGGRNVLVSMLLSLDAPSDEAPMKLESGLARGSILYRKGSASQHELALDQVTWL
eukprot:COSAG06_NODE_2187_length_7387_cov_8.558452_1_plen_209_part_00